MGNYTSSFIERSSSTLVFSMLTVAISITVHIITGDSLLGTAVRVGLQCPIGAAILVIAAPASILEAPCIHLMGDVSAHVREVRPTVAAGIASLHVYGVRAGTM